MLGFKHGDPHAAVVEQQVFEVPEHALQDGHVDMLAIQVDVAALFAVVARFEHDVDLGPERIEQLHEDIEQLML